MSDGKGSFRCLLRNLRKMHEAKTAKPQAVSRETADQLASTVAAALACSDLEVHRDDLKNALAAYRKALKAKS